MFLAKNNQLKWVWIGWTAVLTAVLCAVGVLWLDVPGYLFLSQFDGWLWHFIGDFFGSKVWVFASFPVFIMSVFIRWYLDPAFVVRGTSARPEKWYKRAGRNIIRLKTNIRRFIIWMNFNAGTAQGDLKRRVVDAVSRVSFLVLLSVILDSAIVGPLKYIIGRMRPVFLDAWGDYGFFPFTAEWAFNSMPSGHSAASFAGLVSIGMFFPKIKWLMWGLAVLVAVSRICVGVHFPSDVLFGAMIGMLAADVAKWAVYRVR